MGAFRTLYFCTVFIQLSPFQRRTKFCMPLIRTANSAARQRGLILPCMEAVLAGGPAPAHLPTPAGESRQSNVGPGSVGSMQTRGTHACGPACGCGSVRSVCHALRMGPSYSFACSSSVRSLSTAPPQHPQQQETEGNTSQGPQQQAASAEPGKEAQNGGQESTDVPSEEEQLNAQELLDKLKSQEATASAATEQARPYSLQCTVSWGTSCELYRCPCWCRFKC